MSKLLTVFGATGVQGGSVIDFVQRSPELSKTYRIRGITRDPSKTSAISLQEKGIEIVKADMDDFESLTRAVAGSDFVFAMTNFWDTISAVKETAQGKAIADAAATTGAFLIWSTLPNVKAISNGALKNAVHYDSKAEVETYIRTLPIQSSFLVTSTYMEAFKTYFPPKPTNDDKNTFAITLPIPPETSIPLLSAKTDIGKFIAIILANPAAFTGKTIFASTAYYPLKFLTDTLSAVTGKRVVYKEAEEEEYWEKVLPGMPVEIRDFAPFFRDYDAFGENGREKLEWTIKQLSEKPVTWEEFDDSAVSDIEPGALSPQPYPDEDEYRPLLQPKEDWTPPKGFLWIEIAIFANVFLSGFDGTITASTYALISSEFRTANTASWLTTSYLITSTAFQPLYGRFSDIFGRRGCFFTSTITFMAGCLGCVLARDIITLNLMRALTGLGGGGLMTMATIINSDMIPFRQRGMYQAAQNVLHGFGSICGASLGGSIADSVGWRWCFLFQVPISVLALALGYLVVKNQAKIERGLSTQTTFRDLWEKIDLSGALLLVLGLSFQLVGLSLGGNDLPWDNIWVLSSLVMSVILLVLFIAVEAKTSAAPVTPLRMLRGRLAISTQIANVCVGAAAYAFLFMLPLFFQVVLLDTASKAGIRLVIPSLATPIGGLIAGAVMSRWGYLAQLVRAGAFLMVIGNLLVVLLQFYDSTWKYFVYIIPANLGQGIVYPGILFTFLAAFDHADHAVSASTVYLIRSLGTVYGVAVTSAIVQNTLKSRLPAALGGVPDKWKIIDSIRHSVSALHDLPPEIQLPARLVYYDGIKLAFAASATLGTIATIAALFANGRGLHRSEDR
ncbi:MAG: hypothetical protein M1834_006787 [Cirrosporium novae-zelandiae]|nr:MAG: hypothetical protein M1834_006787 [Cirrosporium novae-zelandiae]